MIEIFCFFFRSFSAGVERDEKKKARLEVFRFVSIGSKRNASFSFSLTSARGAPPPDLYSSSRGPAGAPVEAGGVFGIGGGPRGVRIGRGGGGTTMMDLSRRRFLDDAAVASALAMLRCSCCCRRRCCSNSSCCCLGERIVHCLTQLSVRSRHRWKKRERGRERGNALCKELCCLYFSSKRNEKKSPPHLDSILFSDRFFSIFLKVF